MALVDEEAFRGSTRSTNPITSERELWAWYSYGIAAEVFAVCGVGSFLPVVLEQLAREAGVLRSDGVTSCVKPASSAQLLRRDGSACVVHLFGSRINTSSFVLYSLSIAVVVQTFVLISISAIADYGSNRKKMLLMFGVIGAFASMMFIFITPSIYYVGSLLAIIAISCLGNSFVLLNAFLPLLASNHPSAHKTVDISAVPLEDLPSSKAENDEDEDEEGQDLDNRDSAVDNLLTTGNQSTYRPASSQSKLLVKLSNQISSKGIGLGYGAAVFVQLISITLILGFNKFAPSISKSTIPMRCVLLIVGIWWALFTLPTARWLQRRPGPALPTQTGKNNRVCIGIHYVIFAWKSLWATIKTAAQLRQVVIYLIGWFVLSDAVATISGTAILFARTELQLGTAAVAMLSITATASGIVGAAVWPMIGRRFKLSSIQIIVTCVCLFETIPLYGLLGFLPFVKNLGVGGLQMWYEIYPLAFILGFVMGGIGSYCRSVFGLLIPHGMEAAFYALYAVTDKGSSAIGPVVVGRIVDATGSVRSGFWFLSVVMILPAPIFWCVDVEKGRHDAMILSNKRTRREDGQRLE